ncbi:MAG: hypothetical protein M9894_32210 [Planctomycetes bacterium]|nr:hypothetical protein [Planctomycetota bacterium]
MRFRARWPLGAVCLALAACCSEEQQPPPPLPPPPAELHGLRASASRVERVAGSDLLELTYALEWVAPPRVEVDPDLSLRASNLWLLQPNEPVTVRFLDATGAEVGRVMQRVDIAPEFVARARPTYEALLRVDAPAGTASLVMSLGRSGLDTRPATLPPRAS